MLNEEPGRAVCSTLSTFLSLPLGADLLLSFGTVASWNARKGMLIPAGLGPGLLENNVHLEPIVFISGLCCQP